jgi:hypothetical protein
VSQPAGAQPEAPPATPAAPPPAPTGLTLSGRPGRSFGGGGSAGRWFFVAVMLAISIGGAIIAITATNSVDKTIRKYIPTFPAVTVSPETTPATPTVEAPETPAAPPEGLGPRSLIRHEHFAPALSKLRHGLGRLTNLRLAPESIVVQLVTKTGRLRNMQVGVEGDLKQISLTGSGFTNVPTMPFSQIDSRAPERLVREAAHQGHFKATQIEYLVVTKAFSGGLAWYAYFKNNRRYQGDAAGHVVRRF